jgi:hypothetical protein
MGGGRTDEGWYCARRMLEAMAGEDVETRLELWRAAKRYARRDDDGSAGFGSRVAPPVARESSRAELK